MSGVYFAIGTWIITRSIKYFLLKLEICRLCTGLEYQHSIFLSNKQLYYTALIVAVLTVLVVFGLLRTKTGLALMAIRDSASAAETMGVELYKTN